MRGRRGYECVRFFFFLTFSERERRESWDIIGWVVVVVSEMRVRIRRRDEGDTWRKEEISEWV